MFFIVWWWNDAFIRLVGKVNLKLFTYHEQAASYVANAYGRTKIL